jgi:hypothetical protein
MRAPDAAPLAQVQGVGFRLQDLHVPAPGDQGGRAG